ncbi:uncharacterized protein BDZ99DRAFT_524409 [Mytilinidion resinicola]|uniref:Uncharacterized protein n=1 Tax=Mytilinidion resinicola TaxID=574789 RepID=A0A6A6Y9E5_9PEZI|nr:uncharacterized protein BDZ99DRAFT_524409 [Mytilinidion resinicola]KAF2805436.1 hypothetical protein BDZ99DRAFT_524409 [Mytilinidion resinicola]
MKFLHILMVASPMISPALAKLGCYTSGEGVYDYALAYSSIPSVCDYLIESTGSAFFNDTHKTRSVCRDYPHGAYPYKHYKDEQWLYEVILDSESDGHGVELLKSDCVTQLREALNCRWGGWNKWGPWTFRADIEPTHCDTLWTEVLGGKPVEKKKLAEYMKMEAENEKKDEKDEKDDESRLSKLEEIRRIHLLVLRKLAAVMEQDRGDKSRDVKVKDNGLEITWSLYMRIFYILTREIEKEELKGNSSLPRNTV